MFYVFAINNVRFLHFRRFFVFCMVWILDFGFWIAIRYVPTLSKGVDASSRGPVESAGRERSTTDRSLGFPSIIMVLDSRRQLCCQWGFGIWGSG